MNSKGIYKITNPNNEVYIGQATDIKIRWIRAYKNLNCVKQPKIYSSLLKYGVENHIFEILEECKLKELDQKEELHKRKFIKKYGWSKALFCRLIDGRGGKHSEESKLKMRKPKHKNFGVLISNIKKGKPLYKLKNRKYSNKTKQKMSLKKKGKKHSLKHNINISKSRLIPIIQYDLQGKFIKEWESAKKAGEILKISNGSICECCKNKIKTAGKFKFKWKYKII